MKKYYLSKNKPQDEEWVWVENLWNDPCRALYFRDTNTFYDENALEVLDVKKWWREGR